MNKIISILIVIVALANLSYAQNKKVLFVISEADTLVLKKGKKKRQTGVFLNEFYETYRALTENGYQVDFATPTGKKPTIDQESLDDDYWKDNLALKQEAIGFWDSDPQFAQPMPLQKVMQTLDDYIGLVIPGGQGLMVDLIYDNNIPNLLKYFGKKQKAIGLICHAPALITAIPKDENPFRGYKVNSVTGFEEFYIETFIMKGKPKNRRTAKQLKKLGLKYERGGQGKSFAIRDRNLVTSQNPYSGKMFNELYLKLLDEMEK